MKREKLTYKMITSFFLFVLFQILVVVIFSHSFFKFSPFFALIIVVINTIFVLLQLLITHSTLLPLFKEADKTAELNQILYQLISKSVQSGNKDELYQHILDSAIAAIPFAKKGCILLLNPETNLLEFAAAEGYDAEILKSTYLKLEQTYMYRESLGKIIRTIIIHDIFGYDRQLSDAPNLDKIMEAGTADVLSTLSTPIIYNDRLYGMINVDSPIVDSFTDSDKEIIELFAMEAVKVIKLFDSIEQINYISYHDQLTKIYNRYYFDEYVPKLLKQSLQESTSVILVSLDLNNLKQINDSLGHSCGDSLLSHFSSIIDHNLPENATFFRYGGDEFFLIISQMSSEDIIQLLNTLQNKIDQSPLSCQSEQIPISYSYGFAQFPSECTTLDTLMKLADDRMYSQKRLYHHEKT